MHYTSEKKIIDLIDRVDPDIKSEDLTEILEKFKEVGFCIENFIKSDNISTIQNWKLQYEICKYCFRESSFLTCNYQIYYSRYSKKHTVILQGGRECRAYKTNGEEINLMPDTYLFPNAGGIGYFPFTLFGKAGLMNSDCEVIYPPIFDVNFSCYKMDLYGYQVNINGYPLMLTAYNSKEFEEFKRMEECFTYVMLSDDNIVWSVEEDLLRDELDSSISFDSLKKIIAPLTNIPGSKVCVNGILQFIYRKIDSENSSQLKMNDTEIKDWLYSLIKKPCVNTD